MKYILKIAEIILVYGNGVMFLMTKDFYYLGVALLFVFLSDYTPEDF